MPPRRSSLTEQARAEGKWLFIDWQLDEGPTGAPYQADWSDEEWADLWEERREHLMREARESARCARPWSWWHFEAPQGPQDQEFESEWEHWLAELEFLAEIGELTDEEIKRVLSPRPVPFTRDRPQVHWIDKDVLAAEVAAEQDAVLSGLHKRSTQRDQRRST